MNNLMLRRGHLPENFMNSLRKDFSNLIGFDEQLSRLYDPSSANKQGYPPYNLEQVDKTHYLISVAVAGFSEDDVNIQQEGSTLTITGTNKKEDSTQERVYIHRGLAERTFERRFNLAEDVFVVDATLNDGMLLINLEIIIPEEKKPKIIKISTK